tara:strand:- start:1987 stop:2154 length:168 start_codon:yes stop_codon:yes gene_type:complete
MAVISGFLLVLGFQKLSGQYSSQLETLKHIPYGHLYVVVIVLGVFMIMLGNRMHP